MLSGGCCRWRWVVVGCGAVWGGAGAGPSVCVPCAQRDELLREHDNSGTFHHHLATSTPSWRYSGHSSEDTGKNGCWGFPSIELKCVLEQFVELWQYQYLINKSAGNLATSQAWVQFDVKVTHRNLAYLSRWSIRVHLRPMKPNWLWSWAVLDSTWLYLAHWLIIMDTGQCNDEVGARLISDLTWQKAWGLSRVSSLISKRIVGLGLGVSINVQWSRPRLLNWSADSIFHGRVPRPQQQQHQQHYCSGRWAVAAEEIMMIITLTLAIDGLCLVTRPAVGAISRVLQLWLWYCDECTIFGEDTYYSALSLTWPCGLMAWWPYDLMTLWPYDMMTGSFADDWS